ncbi:MAG: type II toxin-antitoxin system HicB family antitoxin [Stellaceae bacterium]
MQDFEQRAAADLAAAGRRNRSPAAAMIAKYHIDLFWSEADSAWVADVPDLKSCSAFGDTPAEALAEVETAMEA